MNTRHHHFRFSPGSVLLPLDHLITLSLGHSLSAFVQSGAATGNDGVSPTMPSVSPAHAAKMLCLVRVSSGQDVGKWALRRRSRCNRMAQVSHTAHQAVRCFLPARAFRDNPLPEMIVVEIATGRPENRSHQSHVEFVIYQTGFIHVGLHHPADHAVVLVIVQHLGD